MRCVLVPRFAAVQLAFDSPRCRVLIFHTGRLVGTGCSGPMAARLSIMRAARQLAVEAGVHIHVRSFQVINQERLLYLNTHVLSCSPQGLRYHSTIPRFVLKWHNVIFSEHCARQVQCHIP